MHHYILLQVAPDVPDLWKTIVITLFILSMINERITNFLKLNIESVLTRVLGLDRFNRLFHNRTNFRLVEDDPSLEKHREQGIVNIAVLSGFFVAAFCGADLLYMFSQKGNLLEDKALFGKPIGEVVKLFVDHALGYLLTAFFISLGSKFWHDLLDVLLYTSNLKRKLGERADWQFDQITGVEAYVNAHEADPLRTALTSARSQFSDASILGYGLKKDLSNHYYVEVQVADDTVVTPPALTYLHPTGQVRSVPIRQIQSQLAIPLDEVAIVPAANIGNTSTQLRGTLGCIVRRKNQTNPLFLTCYHVVKPAGNQSWDSYDRGRQTDSDRIESPNASGDVVARILEAKRNLTVDVALLEPIEDLFRIASLSIQGIGRVTQHRPVTDLDVNTCVVRKVGINSQPAPNGTFSRLTTGTIVGRDQIKTVAYSDGDFRLFSLLQIKSTSSIPFSLPGDSGSLVVDEHNFGVGIVVAGDSTFSYALALDTVFSQFNLDFYPPTHA